MAELHYITFEIPTAERMQMISRQRLIEKQIKRDLMKVTQRRLSTATLKSMERKKYFMFLHIGVLCILYFIWIRAKLDSPASAEKPVPAIKSIKSGGQTFRTQNKHAKVRGHRTLAGSYLLKTEPSQVGWTPRLQPDGSLNMEIATSFERR